MSRWKVSLAVFAGVLALAACGGSPQNANEPSGRFKVEVASARFPASQELTRQSHLIIVLRNPGPKTIPNPAVTICNITCWPQRGQRYPLPAGEGTSVAPFAVLQRTPYSASLSKQVWIVDRNPNPTPCVPRHPTNFNYSCLAGGPGGMAVGDNSNTWALGHGLRPGRTVTFDWAVTAVCPGHYTVAWQVAAGLFGNAKAVQADGSAPRGTFAVTITSTPTQSYVASPGNIVTTNTPAPAPNGQTASPPPSVPCNA